MIWRKCGLVYAPDGERWWARANASFPTADVLDDVIRVYFTALDERQFGRTGYVDLDLEDPGRVVHEAPEPVLDIGRIGLFDDCGATAFSIATVGDEKYLYYQGWQRTERVPYLLFTGLARAQSGAEAFRKHSRAPILDRTEREPFIRGAPFVVERDGLYRMWYASSRHWVEDEHGTHYEITVRHATSTDGVRWSADDEPAVALEDPDEYAVGRPCVLVDGSTYRMWYSIRSFSRPYRIGYAESDDGVNWTRRDGDAGIDRSADGWDSEMICYTHVVRIQDRLLMFYNGNRHGASGFGYAEAV